LRGNVGTIVGHDGSFLRGRSFQLAFTEPALGSPGHTRARDVHALSSRFGLLERELAGQYLVLRSRVLSREHPQLALRSGRLRSGSGWRPVQSCHHNRDSLPNVLLRKSTSTTPCPSFDTSSYHSKMTCKQRDSQLGSSSACMI